MPGGLKHRDKGDPDEQRNASSKAAGRAKDPLAVELGRRGGLKGGKARAKKLSAKERQEIARRAAKARWDLTR
jgi:hypothetical protein